MVTPASFLTKDVLALAVNEENIVIKTQCRYSVVGLIVKASV